MEDIVIIIEKNRIVCSLKSKYLDNQNIIKIFDYQNNNFNKIINFIENRNLEINEIMINNHEVLIESLKFIKYISSIEKIIIKDNIVLDNIICSEILKISHIKSLWCYDISSDMLDKLEEKEIEVHLRTEILNISNFVFDNKLNLYDDIYYREKVLFNNDITNKDLTGFSNFCEINEYLKEIDIRGKFKIKDLKKIINILIENNLTNVDINIYPEIVGIEEFNDVINELKKINKDYKKNKGIKLSSKYSDSYKKKNYLKQVNFYNLKISTAIIIIIVVAELSYITYYDVISDKTNKEIKDLKPIEQESNPEQSLPEIIPDNEINEEIKEEVEEPKKNIVKDFSILKEINNDTVGWLTVTNTVIDYPVVKTVDNEFYLNKNFYKKTSRAGWIYMDYRNKIENFSKNTIIYGHSGLKKNIMFAGLKQVLKEEWYKNNDNHIISLDTLNQNTKWQIFSIYVTDPSFDYISTFFINNDEYSKFLAEINRLSIYDFGLEVDVEDKILTLTTCHTDNTKRLVVHAKMLK